MQKMNRTQKVVLKADYTTTNAWANIYGVSVGDFTITVKTSGLYDIRATCCVFNNTNADNTNVRLALNGDPIKGTNTNLGSAQINVWSVTLLEWDVYLKAGDVVSLQAIYYNSSTIINVTANNTSDNVIQIRKCP
jgi:hypothetical protein